MVLLNCQHREVVKKNMPKWWFKENLKHTHVASDDALEQGHMFLNMLKAMDNLHKK